MVLPWSPDGTGLIFSFSCSSADETFNFGWYAILIEQANWCKNHISDRVVDTFWTGKRTNYSVRDSPTVKVSLVILQGMSDLNCSSATLLEAIQHVQ